MHVDPIFGAAVDDLVAAPTRGGPLGFDYGLVQRRARDVDDLLQNDPDVDHLPEVVSEAQRAGGLDEEVMLDFSQMLGIPTSLRPDSPSAAAILFIATVGT